MSVDTDAEVRALRAATGQCKAQFTRFERFIAKEKVKKTSPDDILKMRLQSLEKAMTEYRKNQLQINVLLEQTEEEDFLQDDLEERYYAICEEVNNLVQSTQCKIKQGTTKLPNLDIPVYSGQDVTKYRSFIELFNAVIGRDPELAPVQKLCYLRKYLVNEASTLIESLPLVDSSYEEALELLKNRYDNKCILVISHVNNILDYPVIVKGTAHNLRELVSCVRQHTGALRNMGQPVDQWDMVLLPILLRKLDQFTSRAYHSERDKGTLPKVNDLLKFLEERASSFEESVNNNNIYKAKPKVSLPAIVGKKCSFCSIMEDHRLYNCPKFKMASVNDREKYVIDNNLCVLCLNAHGSKPCRYRFKCTMCSSKSHNTLLHNVGETMMVSNNSMALFGHSTVLLPTVKVNIACRDGTYLTIKALLDSGSQTSFLTTHVVEQLKLKTIQKNISISTLGQQNCTVSRSVVVNINSLEKGYTQDVLCSVVDKITSQLPQQQYKHNSFSIPEGIKLADNDFHTPGSISMLLAADVFFNIILPGQLSLGPKSPVLLNTKFGYVVAGEVSDACVMSTYMSTNTSVSTVMHCMPHNREEEPASLMEQFWEMETYPTKLNTAVPRPDASCMPVSEADICEAAFKSSVKLVNGKFHVKLPLSSPIENLDFGDSFSIAIQRLNSLYKKLMSDQNLMVEYSKFINEYIELGHAKIYNLEESPIPFNSHYFLSHHAVVRPDKRSTKLRVVFDGRAKTLDKKLSINDFQYNGKIPQRNLFDILLEFRTYEFVFLTDIKNMFRCIMLDESQRHLQNILWKESVNSPVLCLQLQTVSYGMKSSSYLATRCLEELAQMYEAEFPLAAAALRNSTYCDDILCGAQTLPEAIEVRNQIIDLLQKGGFNLHKWTANHADLLHGIPANKQHFDEVEMNKEHAFLKALGVYFDVKCDQFKVSCMQSTNQTIIWTKRMVLSYAGTLYDPLGLIGPIILKAKLFVQSLWQKGLLWDDVIPNHLLDPWLEFYTSICEMEPIYINRNMYIKNANDVQLIGFCDASKSAYGCAVYVRACHRNQIHVNLLCAKSRVAPLKEKLSIPKLELSSAHLLAQLITTVKQITKIEKVVLFTDSMVTLAWIQSKGDRPDVFIRNRLKLINKLTSQSVWRHVQGKNNVADCLSRGVSPKQLALNSSWFNGPPFLMQPSFQIEIETNDLNIVMESELGGQDVVVECHTLDQPPELPIFNKYSNILKMQRIIAYIFRFYNNCKNKKNKYNCEHLTVQEMRNSLIKIITCIQSSHFTHEIESLRNNRPIKSKLVSLSPFLDADNALRVGGRLHNANVSFEQKHPLILPKNCHITNLIVRQEHTYLLHAGPKTTFFSLSAKFWIINGLNEVKKILLKCVKCFHLKARSSQQLMGSLPRDRVTQTSAFKITGIDYCGAFDVKNSRIRKSLISKGYVALFICFVTKAIHMELVSDMSSETFLAALKRFIARRGLPSRIFCDNATTFKGCNNQLKALYDLNGNDKHCNKIISFAAQQNIDFKYIPSYSPTFGGLWEAGVKSAKYHFRRVIGKLILTYEQFNTVIVQVEGILNSRPLAPLTNDGQDFSCLTPGHFLIGRPIMAIPEPDCTLIPVSRLKLWRQCVHLVQIYWKIWHKCYLNQLQNKPKWRSQVKNLEVGQLVLIKENTAPLVWPLARIVNVFPGRDNMVRVVEIKIPNGHTKCIAANKVCLLPIYDE